ncbi:MAG: hypothetical protein HC934_10135 [Acaryochloridaceae cyanobacterium SU_2_1]|nr:hypothetical protein [Acaryochloridaceae cyanobacterium SU_2_1]
MLETCPRCTSRLGPPLNSGRQVCANCGWSSAKMSATRAKGTSKSQPALMQLLQVCGRIVQRAVRYAISMIQLGLRQLRQSQQKKGLQPSNMVKGLADRLSSLEQAIPKEAGVSSRPWMTPEEAFISLGGDVDHPNSVVHSLDGRSRVPFSRFCQYRQEDEFRAFGLEMNRERRHIDKPWLRLLP